MNSFIAEIRVVREDGRLMTFQLRRNRVYDLLTDLREFVGPNAEDLSDIKLVNTTKLPEIAREAWNLNQAP